MSPSNRSDTQHTAYPFAATPKGFSETSSFGSCGANITASLNTQAASEKSGTGSASAINLSKVHSSFESGSTITANFSSLGRSSDDIRRPTSDFPDERLAQLWDEMDWREAEEILAILQKKLSYAAKHQDADEVFRTQKKIVRNPDIKCLAVRHVCGTKASPGVDGVIWRTSAEKMRAALSLTSKDYHASPLREIIIEARNTGKKRRQGIPTYYDRAMQVLYGYSLLPVTEALAYRASFAFRPGRSTQDAHTYMMEAIKGNDAPEYMVCADVKGCYAHIQHAWLLQHVPMDRHVLREFLNAGIVFAGELFPADGTGISEGANLSPYLGNFTLDGLQAYIYQNLHGTDRPADRADGHMGRYADDVFITVRTEETGKKVLGILSDFLEERGLFLSPEKTRVVTITSGFTFLSRTYIRRNGVVCSYPSDESVERFIDDVCTTIMTFEKSQRQLIRLVLRAAATAARTLRRIYEGKFSDRITTRCVSSDVGDG